MPVYDFGNTDDALYYVVSKLIDGSDLTDLPRAAAGRRRRKAVDIIARARRGGCTERPLAAG